MLLFQLECEPYCYWTNLLFIANFTRVELEFLEEILQKGNEQDSQFYQPTDTSCRFTLDDIRVFDTLVYQARIGSNTKTVACARRLWMHRVDARSCTQLADKRGASNGNES